MKEAIVIATLILTGLTDWSHCEVYTFGGFRPIADRQRPTSGAATSNRDSYRPMHHAPTKTCVTKRVNCGLRNTFPNIDGSCNNIDNPLWGAADTVMPRLLPPEYHDKQGEPRQYGKFRKLPSPRQISNIMAQSTKVISSGVSHMHVLYGQMLAHDIVHTPVVKKSDGSKLDCNCANPNQDCVNIELPHADEQRVQTGKQCFGLSRSKAAIGIGGCIFNHREQTSTMSSVIDGTFLYGKSDTEVSELRDPFSSAGELKLVKNPVGGPHQNLPNQDDLKGTKIAKSIDCDKKVHKPTNIPCFVAGDVRANENPGLQSIQTVWARYHNIVSRGLKSVNPQWSSDKVFSVARRIISALLQSITYREYLPPLLGPMWMKRFDLTLANRGFWNGYDARYNPAITNEFTTAAFRFGHSQVAEHMTRPSSFFSAGTYPDVPSPGTFFSSEPLLDPKGGGCGALMRGFMIDNAEKTDESLTDALRNQLFTEFGKKYGGDLFAINNQRGRDHGLPAYNKYRELCGLPRAKSFAELAREIPSHAISKLQQAYADVDDIDLYAGGLSERHVDGGEVGPTFACILAYGFRALKHGDRYWHEFRHSPSPFTADQLETIRKISLARIICETGEEMRYVVKSPLVMQKGIHGTIVNCENLDKLDLSLWRDSHQYSHTTAIRWETEWTQWFVTSETQEWKLDIESNRRRLKTERPEDVCDDIAHSETRKVPGDSFIQLRFSCGIGTIKSTDFPFQLSQDHRWTTWIETQHSHQPDFSCEKVVAIQVMTRDGLKFASGTGDVFESFSTNGFSCQDHHQPNRYCQRYKVRALCSGRLAYSNPIILPPPTTYPTTTTGISFDVRGTIEGYCQYYGVCCPPNSAKFYTIIVPPAVMSYARQLCREFNVCCDG